MLKIFISNRFRFRKALERPQVGGRQLLPNHGEESFSEMDVDLIPGKSHSGLQLL